MWGEFLFKTKKLKLYLTSSSGELVSTASFFAIDRLWESLGLQFASVFLKKNFIDPRHKPTSESVFKRKQMQKAAFIYICSLASHSPTFTPRRLLVQCVNHGYSRIRGQVELGTEPSTLFIRLVYELLYLLTHSCQNNVIKRSLQQCRAVSVTFFFFTLFTFDK